MTGIAVPFSRAGTCEYSGANVVGLDNDRKNFWKADKAETDWHEKLVAGGGRPVSNPSKKLARNRNDTVR